MHITRSGPLRNVHKLIFNNYNIIKYQFGAGVAGVIGVAESQESRCDAATPPTPALN